MLDAEQCDQRDIDQQRSPGGRLAREIDGRLDERKIADKGDKIQKGCEKDRVGDRRIEQIERAHMNSSCNMQSSLSDFTRKSALRRSEEHTSELQSLMRISYAVFCLK